MISIMKKLLKYKSINNYIKQNCFVNRIEWVFDSSSIDEKKLRKGFNKIFFV